MLRRPSLSHVFHCGSFAAIASALSACATAPAAPGAMSVGRQAAFEGRIVSVDTRPWTYDGNAVVVVSGDTAGTVQVHLPARWNLCRAEPVDVQAVAAKDRVRVNGTVAEPGIVVVCEQPQHHLRKL